MLSSQAIPINSVSPKTNAAFATTFTRCDASIAALYQEATPSIRQQPVANRIVHVVENASQAQEAKRFFSEVLLKLYDRWGHTNVTDLGSAERSIDTLCAEHFVIGEPVECVEIIEQYCELGISEMACLMNFGGPDLDKVERSMRLLAEHVMPHFA